MYTESTTTDQKNPENNLKAQKVQFNDLGKVSIDLMVSREDFDYKEEKTEYLGSGTFSVVYRGSFEGNPVISSSWNICLRACSKSF